MQQMQHRTQATHTHVANKINAWLTTRVDSSGTVMYMSDVKPHDLRRSDYVFTPQNRPEERQSIRKHRLGYVLKKAQER